MGQSSAPGGSAASRRRSRRRSRPARHRRLVVDQHERERHVRSRVRLDGLNVQLTTLPAASVPRVYSRGVVCGGGRREQMGEGKGRGVQRRVEGRRAARGAAALTRRRHALELLPPDQLIHRHADLVRPEQVRDVVHGVRVHSVAQNVASTGDTGAPRAPGTGGGSRGRVEGFMLRGGERYLLVLVIRFLRSAGPFRRSVLDISNCCVRPQLLVVLRHFHASGGQARVGCRPRTVHSGPVFP